MLMFHSCSCQADTCTRPVLPQLTLVWLVLQYEDQFKSILPGFQPDMRSTNRWWSLCILVERCMFSVSATCKNIVKGGLEFPDSHWSTFLRSRWAQSYINKNGDKHNEFLPRGEMRIGSQNSPEDTLVLRCIKLFVLC